MALKAASAPEEKVNQCCLALSTRADRFVKADRFFFFFNQTLNMLIINLPGGLKSELGEHFSLVQNPDKQQ